MQLNKGEIIRLEDFDRACKKYRKYLNSNNIGIAGLRKSIFGIPKSDYEILYKKNPHVISEVYNNEEFKIEASDYVFLNIFIKGSNSEFKLDDNLFEI